MTISIEGVAVFLVLLGMVYFVVSQYRFNKLISALCGLDPKIEFELGKDFHPSMLSWSQQKRLLALVLDRTRSSNQEISSLSEKIIQLYRSSRAIMLCYFACMTIVMILW